MDFDRTFPHKFLLNLGRRPERRVRSEELFAEQGWKVKRQPAVDGRWLKSAHGFTAPGRYAHALGTRMILRRAMQAKAEAVFIFEDDVVFHPDLKQQLAKLELPDDWGIFYLGCQHHERPDVAGYGVVRVKAPLDTHAWGVRADRFMEVRRALTGKFWPSDGPTPAADIVLAELARRIPAYAAYPNLAWQEEEESDLAGCNYGNYDPDGTQRHARHCLRGLAAEALGGKAHPPAVEQGRAFMWTAEIPPAPPLPAVQEAPVQPLAGQEKAAFLFLTRGRHLLTEVWQEYWQGHEDRISIYGHSSERFWNPLPEQRDWLEKAQIAEHLATERRTVSMVRAWMALLKAALEQTENRFFMFLCGHSAPVRPLRDLLRLLAIDGRSRFSFTNYTDSLAPGDSPPDSPVPYGKWLWHTPWMLLNREAAELLAANAKLVDCFENAPVPEACAFGTILNAAGYPLKAKVAPHDMTWSRPSPSDESRSELLLSPSPSDMGDIAGSGCFFARKFGPANIMGRFGLHK